MGVAKNLLLVLLCHLFIIHEAHSKCPKSFACRDFSIEFPFTKPSDPDCGLFMIDNCDSELGHPSIQREARDTSSPYLILGKPSSNKFLINETTLQLFLGLNQCVAFTNFSMLHSPSVEFTFSPNITFFTCYNQTPNHNIPHEFQSYHRKVCEASTMYYKIPATQYHAPAAIPPGCSLNQLPMKPDEKSTDLSQLLTPTFTLEWSVSQQCYDCRDGGGLCSSDNGQQFYCRTQITDKGRWKVIIAICIPIAAVLLLLVAFFILWQRKKRLGGAYLLSRNFSSDPSKSNIWGKHAEAKDGYEKDIELFLKNNGNLAPIRYKYSTIKKITNSFSEKLGRGGFGSVYKGQLPDGHPVAVKVLHESDGNGEDFMNEVASISRTSHINIVSLLGFCFEGSKRALIFDFMPNGSLEKFIGNTVESGLGWDKLFEIALRIARGLEYLHQGCNTRILHLDIKPHNILLDKDLNPRIADFGLAKLCPNRSSIVSMMVARGTIGYIAPEVFSRNFGEVSYKSDVYSYGMLVLEMVGGRRTVDRTEVDRTSEIYFPHYIYKDLEKDADRDGDFVGKMSDGESQIVKRNLMVVGLWCVQTNPKDRPPMTKVVEMLEGKLGTLEVPPKPYLYSPPRSAPTFSNSESL